MAYLKYGYFLCHLWMFLTVLYFKPIKNSIIYTFKCWVNLLYFNLEQSPLQSFYHIQKGIPNVRDTQCNLYFLQYRVNLFFAFDSTTSTASGGRSMENTIKQQNKRLAIRMPNIFCFQHSIPFQWYAFYLTLLAFINKKDIVR